MAGIASIAVTGMTAGALMAVDVNIQTALRLARRIGQVAEVTAPEIALMPGRMAMAVATTHGVAETPEVLVMLPRPILMLCQRRHRDGVA